MKIECDTATGECRCVDEAKAGVDDITPDQWIKLFTLVMELIRTFRK